jgi:preprotein translocase subunit SecD
MTKILALLAVSMSLDVMTAQRPTAVNACPTMEVSIVADKPGDSTRSMASADGRLIFLTEKPLLTIGDFTDANVSLTEGQIVLNVTTTTDGAKRIQTFTEKNVGKQMAFIVNGRLIKLARILDPITGRTFMLSPFVRDEAEKLASSINHKERACQRVSQP